MRIGILIFTISLALSGCQRESLLKILPSQVTPITQVSVPEKQIVSSTLPLVERWRWSGNITAVAITEDRIVIIESNAEQRITVFNLHSGKPIWQSEAIRNIRSAAIDKERIYIGTITYVQAFDLESGQELWRSLEQSSMKRGGFRVYSKGSQLEVYDILEPVVYLLDTTTGQIIDRIPESLFFQWDEIEYSIVQGNYLLEARDAKSDKKLWTYAFPGYITGRPALADNLMLLNTRGQIFSVETRTGKIIWQTKETQTSYTHPQYITDVALQDNIAYVLRYDAAIVGFNPETGEQVGITEMLPTRTMEDDDGDVKHYAIVTSDKFLGVYYGNSQELIVFEQDTSVNENNQ